MQKLIAAFGLALCCWTAGVQTNSRINPDLLTKAWPARWITVAGIQPFGYGVYHFRKAVELSAAPSTFVVHVTADNRYQLFVNGERVAAGPARRNASRHFSLI